MAMAINRQWVLAKRPRGGLEGDELAPSEAPVPEPLEGQILVRNLYLTCEPTQLGWMAGETYLPAVKIGEVMRALTVGRVLVSRHPHYRPGQMVQGLFGFQEYGALEPEAGPYPVFPVPEDLAPEIAAAGLTSTALTAYFGVFDVAQIRRGETVVVSAAAGATGSIAAQLAKLAGCRVVGIAGGPDKCRYLLEELGLHAAIDYKRENLLTRLRTTCPHGVDVYFDNVGGRLLDTVLLFLARRARIALCGAISGYSETTAPPGPKNYVRLIRQRARMEGFLVLDYMDRARDALDALQHHLRAGTLKVRADVQDGIEHAPAALKRLFSGENSGKQLVRVG